MSNVDMEKWRATGLLNGLAPAKAEEIARTLQALMEEILEGKVRSSLLVEKILQLQSEHEVLDRDKAIVELWDAFRAYMKAMVPFASDEALAHPVLDKYRDFVERTRS